LTAVVWDGSPLADLAEKSRRDFPNLRASRERTSRGLTDRRTKIAGIGSRDMDTTVVLMGSWGRAEVTDDSDDDFMLLIDGKQRDGVLPSIDQIEHVFDRPPGRTEIFGRPVSCIDLAEKIGLQEDGNDNLTRRMLFLLEGAPVSNDSIFHACRDRVLARYLDATVKDGRPPRFLLNDVIRYWRTICVDFAGKQHASNEKWGIRNAKLRTYRKVLFAGGLLPLLDCVSFAASEIPEFLKTSFDRPPTDRIASSFLEADAIDAGARALGAYDDFIGLMNQSKFRGSLAAVERDSADFSPELKEAKRLGQELQRGMLALLFETERYRGVVQEYAIF
jgi:hypothetical protein